jgi:hypothetical protein
MLDPNLKKLIKTFCAPPLHSTTFFLFSLLASIPSKGLSLIDSYLCHNSSLHDLKYSMFHLEKSKLKLLY